MEISEDGLVLTIIVPIGPSLSNESNLLQWIKRIEFYPVVVHLVYDSVAQEVRNRISESLVGIPPERVKQYESGLNSPGATRNIGLSGVDTSWVAFWDSDDMVDLEEALNAISGASPNSEVIVGSFRVCQNSTSNSRKINFRDVDNFESNILDVACNPGLWRMIFKHSEIREVAFPNWKMAEDQGFLFALKFPLMQIEFTHKIWYSYFSNVIGQATREPESIQELKYSTKWLRAELLKSKGELFEFGSMLLVRQIGSTLRHGTPKAKLSTLSKAFFFFGRLKIDKKKRFLKATVQILSRAA